MNEQNFSSTDAKFLCKYQVMSFFHHTYCLQNLKITLNWCGEWNSQLNSRKFGNKKLEQFFCMKLFSELIYHISKSNGNVFFGVIWCETHCRWFFGYVCWRGGHGVWMGVVCPCPPVRNDIVTPCHLLQCVSHQITPKKTLPFNFEIW